MGSSSCNLTEDKKAFQTVTLEFGSALVEQQREEDKMSLGTRVASTYRKLSKMEKDSLSGPAECAD